MNQNKNIVSIVLILLLGVLFYLMYQKYEDLNQTERDAILAIPINAAIIVENDDWNLTFNKINQSTIWNELVKNTNWELLEASIDSLQLNFSKNEDLNRFFNSQKLYLSIHHSTSQYNYFVSTLCNEDEMNLILEADSIIGKTKERLYDGVKIYQLTNGLNLCNHNGMLFMSDSELLVEDGIRQLNNTVSLLDNISFKTVQNTKSTFSVAHVYVNYKTLAKLLNENSMLSSSHVKWISRWASWTELDLEISSNDLTFSGFTLVEDSSSNYLTSLFGQIEQKIEISEVAPKNTVTVNALGIENINLFYSNYKEFLAKHNNLYEHNKAINEINTTFSVDIESVVNGMVENEMGSLQTQASSGNLNNYLFFKTNRETIAALEKLSSEKENSSFKENYRGFSIAKIDITNLFSKLYGYLFSSVYNNYYTWVEGYLIVSNSPAELKTFINNFLSEKVLSNNPSYINLSDKITSKCNYLLYYNPSLLNWQKQLNKKLDTIIKVENWSNINGFIYQLSSKDQLFYNNAVLHYEDNIQEDSQLDWIVDLEHQIISSPQVVYNHQSKTHNIIIQDDLKNIFLINESGKILWERKIGGKILDNINQIDAFKNGKLQYIFNTEDSLYLVDRLGRNVENFPISLYSKAKRGHTLVDYDKNRNYRILIPSQDGMLYNYNKFGEKVKGWGFEKLPEKITHQVKYANIFGKDYIYVIDQVGNINIVGRNGKKRVDLDTIPIVNSYYIDSKTGDIYSSDSDGNIWLTTLNGSTSKIKSSQINDHIFYATHFNDDNMMDLFISDLEKIYCYNMESKIMTIRVPTEKMIRAFTFKEETYLGISSNGYCHIFDSENSLVTDKPLFGSGEFTCTDLDKDNKLNLIVINNNILNNYTIE